MTTLPTDIQPNDPGHIPDHDEVHRLLERLAGQGTPPQFLATGYAQGTLADRPAATPSNEGLLYFATDVPALFLSDGSTWTRFVRSSDTITWTGIHNHDEDVFFGSGRPWVDVMHEDFGATGDGTTNDTAAIQAAIDAADIIYFPIPDDAYFVDGSVQLANDKTLVGASMWKGVRSGSGNAMLLGNGTDEVFKTGVYPGGSRDTNRNIRLFSLSVHNPGAPCVEVLSAYNFAARECAFRTTSHTSSDEGCMHIRDSIRILLDRCQITASGGAWAISARDNVNGLDVVGRCILTGGSGGGAVDVGLSQSIKIDGADIESSNVGILVGSDTPNGGQCHGVQITNNYFELVEEPINLGQRYAIGGGRVSDNYISNQNATAPPWHIRLGRCIGVAVESNHIRRKDGGTEPAIDFFWRAEAAPFTFIRGSVKYNDVEFGSTTSLFGFTDFPTADHKNRIVAFNEIQRPVVGNTMENAPTSGVREYVSPTIQVEDSFALRGVIATGTLGAYIDAIEVIEAIGALDCTVRVGNSSTQNAHDEFDPGTLTLNDNTVRRDPDDFTGTAYVSPNTPVTLRVLSPTGGADGEFRIRILYRMLE